MATEFIKLLHILEILFFVLLGSLFQFAFISAGIQNSVVEILKRKAGN
jgi:hypothetical protein